MRKRERKPKTVTRRRAKGGPGTLEIHHLGPHPMIEYFLELLGMRRILDKHIHSTRTGTLSHGEAIAFLVHNILTSRDPLYRLPEWAQPIDPGALGLTPEQKKAINDDRIGRALEQLAEYGGRGVFFQLALRSIKLFRLETSRVHHDTTSITFSGEYGTSKKSPRIMRGYNKDHRPDLKQLVFGLNVTSDGAVPLSHGVYSGNQTDHALHPDNIRGLRDLLEDDFIYVADCKLCTKENLKIFKEFGGQFVTVVPRTRKEDAEFRDKLRRRAARWRTILTMEDPKHRGQVERYETCPGQYVTEDGFRMIWIRSSSKVSHDRDSRLKKLLKAVETLSNLNERINRRNLKSRKQIQGEIDKILRAHGCEEFLRVNLIPKRITTYKRLRRGRPAPGDAKKAVTTTEYSLKIKESKVRLRQERNVDGVFPLVTSLPRRTHKHVDVLKIYKYQPYIERRFENLKTEYALAPAFLKKPARVVGLVHAHFLALTVAALMEREIRNNMKARKIEAIPLYPEERDCKTPTSPRIFELFDRVDWYRHLGRKEEALYPVRLTELQIDVLRLLGVPKTLYESDRTQID